MKTTKIAKLYEPEWEEANRECSENGMTMGGVIRKWRLAAQQPPTNSPALTSQGESQMFDVNPAPTQEKTASSTPQALASYDSQMLEELTHRILDTREKREATFKLEREIAETEQQFKTQTSGDISQLKAVTGALVESQFDVLRQQHEINTGELTKMDPHRQRPLPVRAASSVQQFQRRFDGGTSARISRFARGETRTQTRTSRTGKR